ncbi:MAG TPA: hypothetical protein PLH27_01745, partial [bacterium]|nr:hypothetical protein [bacterium]
VVINNTFGLDYRLYSGLFNFGFQKGMKISGYSNYKYTKSYLEFYQNVPITRLISVENSINSGFKTGSSPLQENLFLSPNSNLISTDMGVAFGFKYLPNQNFNGKMLGYINQNLTGNEIFTSRSEVNFNLFKVGHEPFFLKMFGEIGKFWNSENQHQTNKQNFIDSGFGLRFIGYSLMVVVWKNYNVRKVNGEHFLRKNREAKFEGIFITLDLGYLFRVGIQYK